MATRSRIARKVPRTRAPQHKTVTPAAQVDKRVARPVLVATDGSRAAGAAIRFASAMEQHGSWAPEALTVLEPVPVAVADYVLPVPAPLGEPEFMTGVVGAIRRQLRRFGATAWDFRVEFGGAARSIVDLARKHSAEVIVLGLGKHGKLTRLLGAETAARVCRHSDVPVLAIDAGAKELPHTVVVAMDFGESSVRAAREALAMIQPPGRLHLVHVLWAANGALGDPAWERTYAAGVEHGFSRLRRELDSPAGIEITAELCSGGVIKSVLKVAQEIDADVIAAGSHSQTVVDRLIIGSTPSQLLRAAKCSVLIAPPLPDTAGRA